MVIRLIAEGRQTVAFHFSATIVRAVNHRADRLWVLADIPLPLHLCDMKQFPLSWVVNHAQRIGNLDVLVPER